MKKLNVVSIGLANLRRQGIRTFVMIIFSFVLSASLLASGILKESMQESVDKTINRMGADIVIVPKEYASSYSDSLFEGQLCSFYFDKSLCNKVKQVEGIEKITPQMYIASLAEDCCSDETQLIAFDPETDFIIQPWLNEIGVDHLGEDEVILGSGMAGKSGMAYRFFNEVMTIAGKLDHTGTGYDRCAFINFDTARKIMDKPQVKEGGLGDQDSKSVISSIMIRVKDGENPDTVASRINAKLDGTSVAAYTADGIVSSVADSVKSFASFTTVLNDIVLFLAVLAIVCIFAITIVQRKNEFGIMLTLGASKGKLMGILLTEGLSVSLVGGILGMFVAGGVILAFQDVIMTELEIPEMVRSVSFYIQTAGACLGLSMIAGLVASACAIVIITKGEPLRLIEEVNA